MSKAAPREPPAAMKPAAVLTEKDKQELRDLRIGTGPFDRVLADCVAFTQTDGWTVKKRDEAYQLVWETKPSTHSNKHALRFTATVPRCNASSLAAVVLDDPQLKDDPETSSMYKFDHFLLECHVDKRIAGNVALLRTNYKSPMMLVAPRQMMSYAMFGALLAPVQQQALGVRPRAFKSEPADAPRTDNLMAFVQCSIEYTGSEGTLRKGHERGHTYYYIVMAQEEPDGSITFTLAMDMDPAGKLPAALVDGANEAQHKRAQIIIDLIKAQGPQANVCRVYENAREFRPHSAM